MRRASSPPALFPLLILAVSGTVLACADGGATGSNPAADISGNWTWDETLSDQPNQIDCADQGTFTITQTGSTFTGSIDQTGSCTTPAGPVDLTGTRPMNGGQVSGANVSFQEAAANPCLYQGTLLGDPPLSASGTVSCVGQGLNLTGTWSMTR